MKRLLLLGGLCLAITSFTLKDTLTSSVYICTGSYSKKYHFSKSCRGLSNCKAKIKSVEMSKAKELGRTLCGWED